MFSRICNRTFDWPVGPVKGGVDTVTTVTAGRKVWKNVQVEICYVEETRLSDRRRIRNRGRLYP